MSEPRHPDVTARRELVLGCVILAVLAAVAYLSTVALSGGPLRGGTPVRVALPASGPIVRPGAEVRIGGERAGDVQSVGLDRAGRHAVATLRLDRGTAGAGSRARVRLRGMAGAVYVDLAPGDQRRPLPRGTLVPASPAVGLTDVVAAFDRDTRLALSRTLRGAGGGLAGRGTTLNTTLATAPHALAGVTPVLRALSQPAGRLHGLLDAAGSVADAAAPPRDVALGETVTAARGTFGALAARSTDLGDTVAATPPLERAAEAVLPGADRTLAEAAGAARELRPGIAALAASIAPLRAVAARTHELGAVERLARQALPALHAAAPLIPAMRGPAAGLAAATPSLSTLARALVPYKTELVEAPAGFDRWGNFTYDDGASAGHRAVRFSMILTCAKARDPYPAPGAGSADRKACK